MPVSQSSANASAAAIPAASAPAAPAPSASAPPLDDMQELLALVRERYPARQREDDNAAAATTATAQPLAPAIEADSPSAASDSLDKLALLMALFKARGIEPPPLPTSGAQQHQPQQPRVRSSTGALSQPSRPAASAPVQQAQTASPANADAAAATAATDSAAAVPPVSVPAGASSAADADMTAAEVSQLNSLFDHARAKLFKLIRLYSSGVLKGNAATQAMEKLSTLLRTYWRFIQHAKSHKHIGEVRSDLAADVACASLQQLSDRLYQEARAPPNANANANASEGK